MPIIKTRSSAALLSVTGEQPHERGGGVRTSPLVTPAIGARSFLTGITEIDPGAAVPFHRHNCEESVTVLEGEAMIDVDGEEHRLARLDTTFIPANVTHRFRNVSGTQPVRILWVYGSVAATRTSAETLETHPICAEHGR